MSVAHAEHPASLLSRLTQPPAARWGLFLWPPLIVAMILLVGPQLGFVAMSLHRSLGFGQVSDFLTMENYARILSDGVFLDSIFITLILSAAATATNVILALPAAYLLVRMNDRASSVFILLLVASSFVTPVSKIFGVTLLLGQEGPINDVLLFIGIIDTPIRLIDNNAGVFIGFIQYTLALTVLLLVGAIQTVPRTLEQAAETLGSSWHSMARRIIWPLILPAVVSTCLITFNMNMGAFTSAALLGGGRVLTLPVLIHRTITVQVDYPSAAALSTTLMVLVFTINLVVALCFRSRMAKH